MESSPLRSQNKEGAEVKTGRTQGRVSGAQSWFCFISCGLGDAYGHPGEAEHTGVVGSMDHQESKGG